MNKRILDNDLLKRLGYEVGSESLDGMLKVFLEESKRRIHVLENRVSEEDVVSIRSEAHTLKGIASTFGALAMLKVAQRIEACCVEADMGVMSHCIDDMKQAYADTCTHLEMNPPRQFL